MRYLTWAMAASALIAAPAAAADNDQVRRGPIPEWAAESPLMPVPADASGAVFVRRHDTIVHLDADGQVHHTGYRIKILHPAALQLGNVSLAWNPAAGAPTVHAIRIHRDDAVIDVLDGAAFEVLRREDQLEAAHLDGVLTAVLRVADLRVGDELEVSLTTPASDPTLGAQDSGILLLAPEPAPGRFRLGLSWEGDHKPLVKIPALMRAAAVEGADKLDFRFDNPPIVNPPKDAPARFAWQRTVEYSDFADWAAVSRRFRPLFDTAATLAPSSPLDAEARRIAATHSDPLARAAAALKLVQQQVRYVYVGLNGGNYRPATADETWQRRYGDCKGKTALLLALLGRLGIDADPVLVNNQGMDDGFDARLPSPGLFDHVLVRASIGGKDYWLDGTLPAVATPDLAPAMPYRAYLPLTKDGADLAQFAWKPQARPDEIVLYDIDARDGFERPARIVNTTITRGPAGLAQQAQLSGLSPAQLLGSLRQHLVGDTWQAIDDVKWRYDEAARASILTISGTGPVDWDDDGDGARSLTLPGGGFNPPERRVRSADQAQDVPFARTDEFSCHVSTVRLPKDTDPANWSFNTRFDTRLFGQHYYRAFDKRDGAIHMIRGSRIEQLEIDPALARRDNNRVAAFDNSMARIDYDPNVKIITARDPSGRAPAKVPATDEIDWTADDVPCLAPAG